MYVFRYFCVKCSKKFNNFQDTYSISFSTPCSIQRGQFIFSKVGKIHVLNDFVLVKTAKLVRVEIWSNLILTEFLFWMKELQEPPYLLLPEALAHCSSYTERKWLKWFWLILRTLAAFCNEAVEFRLYKNKSQKREKIKHCKNVFAANRLAICAYLKMRLFDYLFII